jgi:hypothetical protein
MVRLARQSSPQAPLERPEVSRLASEGGAMHSAQRGEPLGVVATEVGVEALVRVDA